MKKILLTAGLLVSIAPNLCFSSAADHEADARSVYARAPQRVKEVSTFREWLAQTDGGTAESMAGKKIADWARPANEHFLALHHEEFAGTAVQDTNLLIPTKFLSRFRSLDFGSLLINWFRLFDTQLTIKNSIQARTQKIGHQTARLETLTNQLMLLNAQLTAISLQRQAFDLVHGTRKSNPSCSIQALMVDADWTAKNAKLVTRLKESQTTLSLADFTDASISAAKERVRQAGETVATIQTQQAELRERIADIQSMQLKNQKALNDEIKKIAEEDKVKIREILAQTQKKLRSVTKRGGTLKNGTDATPFVAAARAYITAYDAIAGDLGVFTRLVQTANTLLTAAVPTAR